MVTDILQPTHLLFILVVALLVLGPKRLPEVARTLGNGLRDFRSAISGESDERPGQSGHYITADESEHGNGAPLPADESGPAHVDRPPTATATPAPPTVVPPTAAEPAAAEPAAAERAAAERAAAERAAAEPAPTPPPTEEQDAPTQRMPTPPPDSPGSPPA